MTYWTGVDIIDYPSDKFQVLCLYYKGLLLLFTLAVTAAAVVALVAVVVIVVVEEDDVGSERFQLSKLTIIKFIGLHNSAIENDRFCGA